MEQTLPLQSSNLNHDDRMNKVLLVYFNKSKGLYFFENAFIVNYRFRE